MGLCPPFYNFVLSPSFILPVSALHPSLHAESGVQLRAGPAEPAKPLETPAQGDRGRGTGVSLCPRGGRSAGLQGPLVASGSRGAWGDSPASRGDGECQHPGSCPAAGLEQGAGSYLHLQHPPSTAAPAFLPQGEEGPMTFLSFGLDEESGRGIFHLSPFLVGFPSSLLAGLQRSGWRAASTRSCAGSCCEGDACS